MNGENTGRTKQKLDPLVVRVAAIMVIGALAPLFDSTMVNVALRTIAENMNADISVVQWITTGYVLAMGLSVPVSAWAVNRFGCKVMYIFSLGIFAVGSVLALLSWNIESLIGFAIIQGVGAGLMMPTLQTELVQISKGRNLGSLMSIVSIPALLGPILGPVLGGILVGNFGWRAIFCVNLPICMIAILLALWGIPADEPMKDAPHLDLLGLLMLSPSFALLIFGIARAASYGGINHAAVAVPFIIGVILMIAFILYALNTKKEPILNVRLFASKNFSISNLLLFLTGILTNGAMLILPLYYQQVRGETVLYAGLWLIPQGIGMLLTRGTVGKIADREGSRNVVLFSLAAIAVGTLPFAFSNPSTHVLILAAGLLVRGAGLGGLLIAIMASAYDGLDKNQVAYASAATRIFQTIGGAFGSAILATVLQSQMAGLENPNAQVLSPVFNIGFICIIVFTLVAVIPAFFLPVHKQK